MAPEIWLAQEDKSLAYDALKTDLFALGVVGFALTFGRMPF